jgi:hypothetical protein
MGQDWRPDEAISPKLIQSLFQLLDERIVEATTPCQLSRWVTSRALFAFLYVFSLQGNEGLLADLKGLRDEYGAGRTHDHFVFYSGSPGSVQRRTTSEATSDVFS